jgi:adenosine deaminase
MIFRHRRTARGRRAFAPAAVSALTLLPVLFAAPAQAASRAPHGPGATPASPPKNVAEAGTAAYLDAIRGNPRLLRDFFRRMPKGGDLHNHLSGAVTTEYLITLAADDGLCIRTATMTAVPAPCGPGTRPAADARTDKAFHDALVRAWSMQDFPPGENGHDHFFATFGKFGEVTWRNPGKLLADVANKAAGQHQFYLETMVSPASDAAKKLADKIGWHDDFATMEAKLVADGKLDALVARARADADRAEAAFRKSDGCGTDHARAGCQLTIRFISQVSRGGTSERVFTQTALGMALAERDPRFVAVNLVQPEDWDSSLRNYHLQMRMLRYLRGVYPDAHLTLHAGELWPGMVKPQALKFHIKEAVNIAGAERIGHGVDLVHEDDWQRTARTMAEQEIAVEVPFTSNAQILGVRGDEHPFNTYRAYHVPVVLATDDEGVSRTDISHEYQYAATTYDLSYQDLKELARASLEYAFLPGRSLWRGNPSKDGYVPESACRGQLPGSGHTVGADCRHLLDASPKAAVQWRQEAAFTDFEHTFGAGH